MSQKFLIAMLGATALVSGCATKGYVRQNVTPVQDKLNQVSDQVNKVGSDLQKTQGDVAKNTQAISATDEKATGADRRAGDAMNRAKQTGEDLNKLRTVVANIDDYKLQTSTSVPFAFDKFGLTASAKEDLDTLAGSLQNDKRFVISVEGFTDSTGNKSYNEALSRKRADAVVTYLVAKHDVPIYRIHMIGLGEDKPVDEGRDRAARAKNRRVEVKVFSAELESNAAAVGTRQ